MSERRTERRPPSVERVLAAARPQTTDRDLGAVLAVARSVVDEERARLAAPRATTARSPEELGGIVVARLAALQTAPGPERVINATGVIVHTNLGRAPWPAAAVDAARAAAEGTLFLELDRASGRRGRRYRAAEAHLVALTGAEDALIVTNNAAAVALAVGLAGRGGVAVSRGELVEIGGGVRIPEIVRRAGARLVEVGTTNRTRVVDFVDVLADGRARVVLRVHPSNFSQAGFVEAPDAPALASAAHRHGALVIDDLGSGALLDTAAFGLAHEPMPAERLADGADLVTFSGDKLVGGPQAGFIVGRADLVARLRKDPLARAMRPDKVVLAAVAATLGLYRAGVAVRDVPVWRQIAASIEGLTARAEAVAARAGGSATVAAVEATVGGGSLPGQVLPSRAVCVTAPDPDALLARLRAGSPAVVGRIEHGAVLLDLRSVEPVEDAALADALHEALAQPEGTTRAAAPMTIVVGTAGHIDHGKTTLLRALTGIDADRLPEERARGMTIDVGYAHLALEDGTELDFVDVPGHDRLVGNMLVGAGEIDAALLVVAADDGPRAQTIEHLQLLDALAIVHGIAVITKSDAVEPERVVAVKDAVRALLAGSTLADAPVLAVSAQTGSGLAELGGALIHLRDQVVRPDRAEPSSARVAIDRVFSIKGRGTVVTGSLRGGRVAQGDTLRIVPGPDDATVRVREVQVHGATVETAGPGRVALNVVGGESVEFLARGVVLTADPALTASDRLLVALRPIASLGTAMRASGYPADRTRVAVHAGTAHVGAAVGRSGRDAVDLADGEATAILRLAHPIAVAPGDRFALRRQSPAEPLGGGRVLDPHPPRGTARRRSTPDRLRALAATEPGSVAWTAARLDLHGALTLPAPGLADDVTDAVDAALLAAAGKPDARRTELLRAGAIELRRRAGSPGTGTDALVAGRLNELVAGDQLVPDGDRIRVPGAATSKPTPDTLAAMDRLEERLSVVAPPTLSVAAREAGCPPDGIRALERANRIVRLDDDLAWAFVTYRDLAGRALEMARSAPLTPAAYRDATGTSRKYVLAILEDLDRRAILRRTAQGHVPGPRAPRPAQPATTGRPG